MVADGVGGGDGEDFIQGADAARKGYEDVALGKHQVLAVAEIITRNLDVEVWKGSSSSLYKRRNHTDGSAAIRLYSLADAIHQTGVAAAVCSLLYYFLLNVVEKLDVKKIPY